ncbi:hypothetical protein Patl1_25870 [Pistacia atlantica]|uniref:Uncharacterized protein n=1 Tax=Pistacia atlantica TaxID=434234 RepID=A0ACC1B2U4_9ROSI|nr:hypothetical protein Patl1_25870 [Pistacia atlantica]
MAVTQRGVCLCLAVVLMFFVGVLATVPNDDLSVSRKVKTEQLQSLTNSTMAARSEDDDVHEHAVDNPEEIAAEVEM